jgi:hypothetical protein
VRHLRYLQSISTQQLKRLILKLAPTLVQQQQQQQPLQQSSGSNSAISNLAFASPLSGKTPVKKSQLPPLFNFGGPIVSEEKSINESPAAVAPQQANITVFNSGRGSFENYTVKDETMSAGDTESIPEDIIEVDDIETADVIADNNDHLDALW